MGRLKMASHTRPRSYRSHSEPRILSSRDLYNLAPVSKEELAAANGEPDAVVAAKTLTTRYR